MPKPGISRSQVRAALARALAGTAPGSGHARLLAAALGPATQASRPPAEVAVRALLARAQVPTPAAVAGQLVAFDHHRAAVTAREQRRQARRAPDASEAARAATLVAEHWQVHGHGPTWRALGRAMGWPPLEVASTIRGLAALGWLTLGEAPRSLRPGPRLGPSPDLVGCAASRPAGRSPAPTGA
jgi:hypothetical protein